MRQKSRDTVADDAVITALAAGSVTVAIGLMPTAAVLVATDRLVEWNQPAPVVERDESVGEVLILSVGRHRSAAHAAGMRAH